jgi:hypothetical protein
MDHQTQRRLPWGEVALLLVMGIPAFAIALLCGLFVWTYTGPQYDIQIINDHEIGGTFDRVVALAVATFCGALGIFSALRLQRRMSDRHTDTQQAFTGTD